MSPALNLLDWRSLRRARAGQRLRGRLQLGLLAALLLLLTAYGVLRWLSEGETLVQKQLRAQLQHQQLQLKQHYERAEQTRRWQQHLQQIDMLRQQRQQASEWLDALAQSLPVALHWTELQQLPEALLLKGQTTDTAQLNDYLQALQQSTLFTQVELQAQRRDMHSGHQGFVLSLKLAAEDAR